MLRTRYSLGVFGDARLEKRGPSFWAGWCDGAACAFAVWRGGDGERLSPITGFYRTRR